MVTDLLFEIEFDKFHFEEIHNNPPKGIFKPPKKRRENYSGINFSSNNSINCNSCFDDELDDLLAKREPDFYDFITANILIPSLSFTKKPRSTARSLQRFVLCGKQTIGPASPLPSNFAWHWNLPRNRRKKCLVPWDTACQTLQKWIKSLCSLLSIMTSIFLKSTTKSGRRPNTATSSKTCKMRFLSGRRDKIIQMII